MTLRLISALPGLLAAACHCPSSVAFSHAVSGGCGSLPADLNPALLPLAVLVALGLLRRRRKAVAAASAGKWRRTGLAGPAGLRDL